MFNKKFLLLIACSILISCTFSITFSIGIFDNPDFTIQDFCMNLASELIGLLITVLVVDTYLRVRRNYLMDRKAKKEGSMESTQEPEMEHHFEITDGADTCTIQSISTIKDQKTGIQYLLIVHEHGSVLTPLLDSDGKPVT